MRLRTSLSALRRRATATSIALLMLGGAVGVGAAGCSNDLNVTDPNAPNSTNFFKTARDADAALTATYNTLLRLGTYQRWQAFSYDLRSDIGTSTSPWAELQAFVKFKFPSGYDFDINRDTWNETYSLISNANQVTTNVPGIDMDAATRSRIVGEAQFLRGLGYFHLMTLYGGNIPLITEPVAATARPGSSDSAAVWAQIEKDFTEAAAALPVALMSQTGGRASKGAAQGMLGKTLLQERKWAAAATALQPVVQGQSGAYKLEASYANLFRNTGNNSDESLFEVEVGNEPLCASQGLCGLNISRMVGPCGPSYCDGLPTRWYFDQFFTEPSTGLDHDQRLDATIYYYRGDTTKVYASTWAMWETRRNEYKDHSRLFFKKYGEYYKGTDSQSWEAEINYKVLRYADVLLMYAEALNEQNQTASAYQYVDMVRARVGLPALPRTLSQTAMRAEILHQRLLEFGLEGERWLDLGRQNLFADLATLRAHDADFNNFEPNKSEVLPIPQAERNLNPNITQNPGY